MSDGSLTGGLRETLGVFEGAAPLTTPEVAGRLDIGRRAAYARLNRLAERGRIETKKVGANARVWWRPDPAGGGRSTDVGSAREQSARERELERYETIVETVDDGIYVVDADGYFTQVNDSYESMVGRSREELIGAHVSTVVDGETVREAKRLESELAAGERSTATLEATLESADGESRTAEATFALMEAGESYERVAVVRDTSERKERERELERRRERLAALNSLNEALRDVTDAVIDESTRAAVETAVCERLAASESYLYAWVGEAEAASDAVRVRTDAGLETHLAGETLPEVGPDRDDPAREALRSGEVRIVHEPRSEPRRIPRCAATAEYDELSAAAIPVTHEGTAYGVLTVCTDRPDAFTGEERAVVSQLGGIVGHAIAATERKRALMGEGLVELEFQARDAFAAVDAPVDPGGRITFDRTVPVDDGEFLVYGTATADGADSLRRLVDHLPSWASVSFDGDGDDNRFELRVTDPPVISDIASLGVSVERAVIDEGDYRMTVHLAPGVDVREVIDVVEDGYPDVDMIRRRQVDCTHDDVRNLQRRLVGALTDRQRTALQVAYHAGFFDWPRNASGKDLAETLDVTPPTFHQHLREAQRKVFDAVLSTPVGTE